MVEKLNFDKKINELSEKAAQLQKELDDSKNRSQKAINEQLKTAEGNLAAFKEQIHNEAEQTKSHTYSELLKLQMTFNGKKDDFRESIVAFKHENARGKAEKEVERALEYAAFAIDAALFAIGEASIAVLDAASKELDYEENFPEN